MISNIRRIIRKPSYDKADLNDSASIVEVDPADEQADAETPSCDNKGDLNDESKHTKVTGSVEESEEGSSSENGDPFNIHESYGYDVPHNNGPSGSGSEDKPLGLTKQGSGLGQIRPSRRHSWWRKHEFQE